MVRVFAMVDKSHVENELSKKYKSMFDTTDEYEQEYISHADMNKSDDVLLFFSFDIVNSSTYKSNNYYGWFIVIDYILTDIRQVVRGQIGLTDAEVWRILGDEVVFIINIGNKEKLIEYVSSIYKVLIQYCESIENGELLNRISQKYKTVEFFNLHNVISLQASAWIATVVDKNNISVPHRKADNVFEIIEERKGIKFYEFTGIDIDAGFRLSKQTRAKRLVLSFELAYLLSQDSAANRNLYIVTYCSLKGIWNDNVYPIIWYYDSQLHNGISFEDSIPFDASINDSIYAELLGEKRFNDNMYDNANLALDKVCKDRRLGYKIKRIEELIGVQSDSMKPYLSDPKLELHLVAICYNVENKSILVVKRNDKRFLPGKWEFGCAKANLRTEIGATICREYKQDFGIDIEIVMDQNRADSQPIPLAVYSIEKNQELHKGIIFLAKIIGGNLTLNRYKHQDYKYITESELPTLNKLEYVNDALDTMQKAFKLINELGL